MAFWVITPHITIHKDTKFYRGPDIEVPSHLYDEAEAVFNPPSKLISLREVGDQDQVPVRNIRVEEDGFQIREALWRKASVEEISVAEMVSVSHLRVEPSA
ncbi:hypothetical protein OJAV_G00050100 [Oryzias javanicus]|uniref:Uncharacterized protein n=1 Tax=Oryzias javanicus TaxID=123683 RepID=A0A3S2PBJ8_ORYJA|nr:hypothetical protein OJAV_G00050100 [Oryzias javanicus]